MQLSMLKKGDVILLAGKGHETYQEINGKKNHMDERDRKELLVTRRQLTFVRSFFGFVKR